MKAVTICLFSILLIYTGYAGGQSKKPVSEMFNFLKVPYIRILFIPELNTGGEIRTDEFRL